MTRQKTFLGLSALAALCLLAPGSGQTAPAEVVVCEDSFQDSQLASGWSWLREHPEYWRIKDGALEIRVEPGKARTVRNALLRAAPDRSKGRYAVEVTVRNLTVPSQQFEQAGITWYHDGKPGQQKPLTK